MSANPAPPLQHAIRRLAAGASLTADESRAAFETVMSGEATVAQIASLLVGLRVKGETPDTHGWLQPVYKREAASTRV